MSCAANRPQTLNKISSLNADGIDRKLNVAISRARKQFVCIGMEEVLAQENSYQALISKCHKVDLADLAVPHYS